MGQLRGYLVANGVLHHKLASATDTEALEYVGGTELNNLLALDARGILHLHCHLTGSYEGGVVISHLLACGKERDGRIVTLTPQLLDGGVVF